MPFRWRPASSARRNDGRTDQQRAPRGRESSTFPKTSSDSDDDRTTTNSYSTSQRPASILRPFVAGMVFAASILYILGWDASHPTADSSEVGEMDPRLGYGNAFARGGRGGGVEEEQANWRPVAVGSGDGGRGGETAVAGKSVGEGRVTSARDSIENITGGPMGEEGQNTARGRLSSSSSLIDEVDVMAVTGAIAQYAAFARKTLAADQLATEQGKPLQGKYIVLESGNELANRLRGVLSGFFLGVLTDRVFIADITYQKDVRQGLLSALFEGPGYQWDLSQLPPLLSHRLAPSTESKVLFDMQENDFHRWVCEDVLGSAGLSTAPVVTLSTIVYPLPLLARNPAYSLHPILAASLLPRTPAGMADNKHTVSAKSVNTEGGLHWKGFAGGRQGRIETLETLLTRVILRPTEELRHRAGKMVETVREKAAAWGREKGMKHPPRVVGLHLRTYFVNAVSPGELEENLEEFANCAAGETTGDDSDTFYFVATDEAKTQAVARKVWGDGCFFADFGLPGSKREGIKSALVDLLVMGSLDDFVITPHSSFSELGATLSFTWLPDVQEALRTVPNRPVVPVFSRMNDFERRKVLSLLDRRATRISAIGGVGQCMRLYAAGMSLAVAKGEYIRSMFEVIENADCLRGVLGIADV